MDQEDPLEKGIATQSSILTWRIPWTKEPGGLQSRGCRVGYNWATELNGTELITPSGKSSLTAYTPPQPLALPPTASNSSSPFQNFSGIILYVCLLWFWSYVSHAQTVTSLGIRTISAFVHPCNHTAHQRYSIIMHSRMTDVVKFIPRVCCN